MNIDTYLERLRLARSILEGTPRALPKIYEADVWWWYVEEFMEMDKGYLFLSKEEAERAWETHGKGLVHEPMHVRSPVMATIEGRLDDGITVLFGSHRNQDPIEIVLRQERFVPCDTESEHLWDRSLIRGDVEEDEPWNGDEISMARAMNCASVDSFRARLDACRLLDEVQKLKGDTLAFSIEHPDRVQLLERALSVLGKEETAEALLHGTADRLSLSVRHMHETNAWHEIWNVLREVA